jgi:hypothetical protein
LDFIFEETQIFITSSNNQDISIIPKTLRELNNFITLIYYSNNKKKTFKDYIINVAKVSLTKDLFSVFDSLEDVHIQDFSVQLCNLLAKTKRLNLPPGINYLLYPRNKNNTSLGDVYSILKIIEEKVNVTNLEVIKFLNFLKVYIAIILKELKVEEIVEISQGGFYNEYFKIFPQYKREISRDWLNFELKELENIKLVDKFILSFYIPYLGDESKRYRADSKNIFFKPYNRPGGQFSKATFSPLYPLTRIIYLDRVLESFKSDEKKEILNLDFYKQLKKYSLNDFSLIMNPFYYLEFIDLIDKKAKNYKEGKLGEYGETINLYINQLGVEVINQINEQYQLNVFNFINENPIYKVLPDYIEEFNNIFKSFIDNESDLTSEIIELLNTHYDRVRKNKKKKDAVTRLKKDLIKKRAPNDIINDITLYRDRLDDEEESIITEEILEYLSEIITNG